VSPLLNYTTTVPVSRTIGQVHALLVEGGARQIMTTYNNVGTPTGVAFAIEVPGGNPDPDEWDDVLNALADLDEASA
jgi:hypothetical protein